MSELPELVLHARNTCHACNLWDDAVTVRPAGVQIVINVDVLDARDLRPEPSTDDDIDPSAYDYDHAEAVR